ncbi:MAG: hypothetical protein F6K16_37745 [Symploca sp. SIO2B6]|nr:hypothetical protein [Symploca sp. SIO2B6]
MSKFKYPQCNPPNANSTGVKEQGTTGIETTVEHEPSSTKRLRYHWLVQWGTSFYRFHRTLHSWERHSIRPTTAQLINEGGFPLANR